MAADRRSVLITGCSQGGIGDALAQEFHNMGLRVLASARNLEKVQHLKEMGIEIVELDVTSTDSIKAAVEKVRDMTGGTLDILVNNAGRGYSMPLMDSDVNAARSMFDVNVFGLVAVTQAFIPLLIRSSRSGSFSPRIINMSSVVSRVPVPWQAFYNASKAAVEALGDAMRIELAPWGVTVINVMAGGAGTHFIENAQAIAPIAGVFDLPRDSIYGPARDDLVPVLRNGNPVQRALLAKCSPQRLAAAVASNALKRKPKKQLWVGEGAWMSWFASTFLWHTWSELLVPRKWRLQKIFRKLSAASRG